MSEALYERYKDALRRGHIAAQRGRPEEALTAYRAAIEIAPDRVLPYVSVGNVLSGYGVVWALTGTAVDRHPRAFFA